MQEGHHRFLKLSAKCGNHKSASWTFRKVRKRQNGKFGLSAKCRNAKTENLSLPQNAEMPKQKK